MRRALPDRLVVLVSVIACLIAGSALISNLSTISQTSDASSVDELFSAMAWMLLPSIAVLWVLAFALALIARRKMAKGSRRRWGRHNAVLFVLIILGLIIFSSLVQPGNIDPGYQEAPYDEGQDEDPPPADGGTGGDLEVGPMSPLSVLPLVAVLAIIAFLAVSYVRKESGLGPQVRPEAPRECVEAALTAVDEGDDVRAAILGAYRRMCRMTHRPPEEQAAMTPRELESDVLSRLNWPSGPLARLTELFEEARYSHHPLGEEKRSVAQASLRSLLEAEGSGHE